MTVIFVEMENCRTTSYAWARALSWFRAQESLCHMSGHLHHMFFLIHLRTSQ